MKYRLPIIAILLLVFSMGFMRCNCNKQQSTLPIDTSKQKALNIIVPSFNEDSAYAFTAKQVSFGPRIPGTKAQTECANWLTEKLKSYTPNVIVQNAQVKIYNGSMVPCKNIIASFDTAKQKRILLFAHWDTRPWADQDSINPKAKFDGADDAASGVATLIEMAHELSKQDPGIGVDILLVDVEDYGPPSSDGDKWGRTDDWYALGTQYWSHNPHVANYKAYFGVLLDMSGAKNAVFPKEGVSMQYAPDIVNEIWNTASSIGYGNYFINEGSVPITDDHTYVNSINGTPSVDIIWLDKTSGKTFAPHWHTQQDNMKVIDKNTLKAVGQTLLQVIYQQAVVLNV